MAAGDPITVVIVPVLLLTALALVLVPIARAGYVWMVRLRRARLEASDEGLPHR